MTDIQYDLKNDMAYLMFTDQPVKKSVQLLDELVVIDLDENEELVAIEVMSVEALRKHFETSEKKEIDPQDIPFYLLPTIYNYKHNKAA